MAMLGPAGGGQQSVLEGLARLAGDPKEREKLSQDTAAYERMRDEAAQAQSALAEDLQTLADGQKDLETGQAEVARVKQEQSAERTRLDGLSSDMKAAQGRLDGQRKSLDAREGALSTLEAAAKDEKALAERLNNEAAETKRQAEAKAAELLARVDAAKAALKG